MEKLAIPVPSYDPQFDPIITTIPPAFNLYVGNIPEELNNVDYILTTFSQYGTITQTIDTKQKNYFITYELSDSVENAFSNEESLKPLIIKRAYGKLYQSFYDLSPFSGSSMADTDTPPPDELLSAIRNFSATKLKKVKKEGDE